MSHFIKRTASTMHQYLRARAEHEYNELSLQLETKMRETKEYFKDNVPRKVYTDIGKVYGSFTRMRKQYTPQKVCNPTQLTS
jgi:hypothetical protein